LNGQVCTHAAPIHPSPLRASRELPRPIRGNEHPARVQRSRYWLQAALHHTAHGAHLLQHPQYTAHPPTTCSHSPRLLCLHVQVARVPAGQRMLTAAVSLLQIVTVDAVDTAVRAKSVAESCQPTPCMHAPMPPACLSWRRRRKGTYAQHPPTQPAPTHAQHAHVHTARTHTHSTHTGTTQSHARTSPHA
jgi:hypothetical protein